MLLRNLEWLASSLGDVLVFYMCLLPPPPPPPSEEEIGTMQLELDKYGINMPSFGKIGGILANEVRMCVRMCSIIPHMCMVIGVRVK